ncbi:penicillin-binding protein 1A [Thalassotalea ponticola]|uniref:penicillin-binding protein 1A n=1 Tax=Thalassotalea ponticola TaxID=1523392 RepID=UPI0025B2FC12|nr:penicillin-binding protein 1A [Thalassotalea ponticola]MDN3652856.1 penicillin-binding protein 1A [Thalassotalea ponticola]
MQIIKWLLKVSIVITLLGITAVGGFYLYMKKDLPSVEVLKDIQLQIPMQIYSNEGKLISQYGTKRRIPVKLEDMPPKLIQAILATEDNRFYEHFGVDPIGMLRAAFLLVTSGEIQGGASTITMQTARNFFLTREQTFIRKIREIFISLHMESLLTKDEILELYLNKIELSHRAFGVGAAAQVYYGKELDELTLGEIAVIAGLPKAPTTYNPISSPERAKFRRTTVLQRMLVSGYITEQEYDQANNEDIHTKRHGVNIEVEAPYVASLANKRVLEMYGRDFAYGKGLKVYTTVQADLQQAANQAVIDNIYAYDQRHGYRGPIKRLWLTEQDRQKLLAQYQTFASAQRLAQMQDEWAQLPSSPITKAQIEEQLNDIPTYNDLQAVAVLSVEEQSAQVITATGESVTLTWDGLKWARWFIDDKTQGKAPDLASEIVSAGDIVYVRQLGEDNWLLSQLPEVSAGLVAISPDNGAILASVGGYSFKQSQFDRITQANRQMGSNIKPFVYSAALANGYTLASLVNDAPINQWDKRSGFAWRPKNSPAVYEGPLRVRVGLAKSKNVMSIRLLRGMTIDALIEHLSLFGFNQQTLPRNESIALGSASATPLQVVTGYASFANQGYLIDPYVIDRIEDASGNIIYQASPPVACYACEQAQQQYANSFESSEQLDVDLLTQQVAPRIISRENAFLVTQAMNSVIWGSGGDWSKGTGWIGTGWRAKSLERRDLAGKTGTTNESKDAWFSGFSRHLAASSWIGFDDPSRTLGRTRVNSNLGKNQTAGGEAGANAAQPAWIGFMKTALEQFPYAPFEQPNNIVSIRIDKQTGKRTNKSDSSSRFEYFIMGTEPQEWVTEENVEQLLESNDQDEPEIF